MEKAWSWENAYEEFVLKKIIEQTQDLENIKHLGGYDKNDVWNNNMFGQASKPLDAVTSALKRVKDNNALLGSVIISPTNTKGTTVSAKPMYLTTTENNLLTITRRISREGVESMFKKRDRISGTAEARMMYANAKGTVVLDLIQETYAKDLRDLEGQPKIYQKLRTLFTEVLNATRNSNDLTDFVKMREIGQAFKVILDDTYAVNDWKQEYKMYVSKIVDAEQVERLVDAMKDTLEYFQDNSFFVDGINMDTVEALVGRILFEKKSYR